MTKIENVVKKSFFPILIFKKKIGFRNIKLIFDLNN